MATRYAYGNYLRQAALKGTQGDGKSDDENGKRVVKPMKSTQGVIRRPKPGRKFSAHQQEGRCRRRG